MLIQEFYEKIGGDYEDIKGRLRSDDLIERFLRKFLNEKSYEELLVAAEANQIQESISAAHKLKGVAANLSFVKLHQTLTVLLTQLRQENQEVVDEQLMQQVKEYYNQIIELLQEM